MKSFPQWTNVWLARCTAAKCKWATRTEGGPDTTRRCSDHKGYRMNWSQVIATTTEKACSGICINARGGTCDCSCGGQNHGAGHAA